VNSKEKETKFCCWQNLYKPVYQEVSFQHTTKGNAAANIGVLSSMSSMKHF
jgi:hypothetical protein